MSTTTTDPREVIAKGPLSDEAAKAEKLARFGHHPDPAIDFEIEVQSLEARLIDAENGYAKIGTEPEAVASVLADIKRAMEFRVGGDPSAVAAKQALRNLEARALTASGHSIVPAKVAHYEEADRSELVVTDEPHVYAETVSVQVIRSAASREIVGFAWPGREPPRAEAAEAANAAVTADRDRMVEALEKIRRLVSYPCSTEIDPRGYGIHVAPDAPEYIMELIDAALTSTEDLTS